MSNRNSDFLIKDGILKEYRGNDKNIIIPFGVICINKGVFEDCSAESIIIPNSITEIKTEAFIGCHSLTKIVIPDSVTSIGEAAFYHCKSLVEVKLSKNITSIELETFAYSDLLKHIIIPDNVKNIEEKAFCGCRSLETIIIPKSVTDIGPKAFAFCLSLSKVIFEGELEKTKSYIFLDSKNIKEIKVCSEQMMRKLAQTGNIHEGCKVIVDKSLNNEKPNITLGSTFISTSCNPLVSHKSTIKKSDFLPNLYEFDESNELI